MNLLLEENASLDNVPEEWWNLTTVLQTFQYGHFYMYTWYIYIRAYIIDFMYLQSGT